MELISKLEKILGEENLDDKSVLNELEGYDSLNLLSIIAMIKKDYNITLKAEDIAQIKTVGDLKHKING